MRVKIGDDILDQNNSIIAQTYGVNEIGDITNRQGGFSNDFTIPLTSRNQKILGIPNDINSTSAKPFQKVVAELVDNGTTVASGNLKYQIANKDTLQCSFFSDNTSWFADIKDKVLSDLDLTEYNHVRSAANIDASTLTSPNTSGYIYPLIDYGEFLGLTSGITATVDKLYPAMYVSTLIEKIFFEIGWKVAGEVTEYPLYKKLILPFSQSALVLSDSVIEAVYYKFQKANSQLMATNGTYFVEWNNPPNTIIKTPTTGVYNLNIQLVVTGWTGTLTVEFWFNGVLDSTLGTISANGTYTYYVQDLAASGGNTMQVKATDTGFDTAIVTGDSFFERNLSSDVSESSTIAMNRTLPKLKQTELIQYIFFAFGVIAQANVNSKTVTFSFFRSVKANLKSALDWSNKLDMSKVKDINFTKLVEKYSSVSELKYIDDTNDPDIQAYKDETGSREFGDGEIQITNEHLSGRSLLYTAPFSSMINIDSFGGNVYVPQIRWLDSTGAKEVNPFPKIAIIETGVTVADLLKTTSGSTFNYGSNSTTTMPFCWFVKTEQNPELDLLNESLAFNQVTFPSASGDPLLFRFFDDYQRMLNQSKYLRASFKLDESDINALDFTIPIYISHYKAYFYLNKVKNYKGNNTTTECELVNLDVRGSLDGSVTPTETFFRALESSSEDIRLLEDGGKRLLEYTGGAGPGFTYFFELEAGGSFIELEDGDFIIKEDG